MSYPPPDQSSGQYPARGSREPEYGPPSSDYPPPPGGEDEARARGYAHARTPSTGPGVTLPSIAPSMSNAPPYDSNQQQPPPQSHPPQQPQQHYGPPPTGPYGPPPPQQHDPRAYQYPPPHQGPPVPYGQPYPPQPYPPPNMQYQQSAPRQRTAIACRYCRRRKIRCSGFENHPNGQCNNCARFHQECIFTPVSSQTQAFVPAHVAYPGMRNIQVGPGATMMYPGQGPPGAQQLYGAHGQPIGTIQTGPAQPGIVPYGQYQGQGQGSPQAQPHSQHPQHQYPQQPPPQSQLQTQAQQQPQQHATPQQQSQPHPQPSPTGSYGSFSEEAGGAGRKRPKTEPHTANAPPPMPGQAGQEGAQRRAPAVKDEPRPLPPATPTASAASTARPSDMIVSPASTATPLPQQGTPSTEPRSLPSRTSPSERSSDPMSIGSVMEKGVLDKAASARSGDNRDDARPPSGSSTA